MFVLTGGNVLYISEMQTHLSVLMKMDWRKARRCAKESPLALEPGLGESLLLWRGDGTEISGDETRNQQ